MLDIVLNAIKSIMAVDPSIDPTERQRIICFIKRGPNNIPTDIRPEARILDRAEVAKRLSTSPRTVDRLARQGVLQRVTLPGRKRAAGFREQEVTALVEGRLS